MTARTSSPIPLTSAMGEDFRLSASDKAADPDQQLPDPEYRERDADGERDLGLGRVEGTAITGRCHSLSERDEHAGNRTRQQQKPASQWHHARIVTTGRHA